MPRGRLIQKRWVFRDIDGEQKKALALALAISPITASVLIGRGMVNPEQARCWLSPREAVSHDPFLLPDMERAVDRLHQAVVKGEHICFYGDYDVDGISATSLYVIFFRQLGANVSAYIPDRAVEGYGLNEPALRSLVTDGVGVLVTVDCGTTSHREVEVARNLGLDVMITDHHQIQDIFPSVLAFLNPHRPDSRYPFAGLCSAGIAYKVVLAYARKYGSPQVSVESFQDLVALATIADIVSLQDENRVFVREGLALITNGTRCGIRALKQRVGGDRVCTANTIAFRLAPVINAAGRLAHALSGVQLLTTESDQEAKRLAGELDQLNRQRRGIEQTIFGEAQRLVERTDLGAAIVVGARHWHIGVLGIVASRLVERYHRPAVVLALDEQGIGKGSVRSVPGFDVRQALGECRELLEGFGGHPAAAGLTIREACLSEFREKFQSVTARSLQHEPTAPTLNVDDEVRLEDVHPQLLHELELLHPFGMGNPEPTFVVKGLTVLERKVVGDDHLKLVVRHARSVPFESIGFRMGSLAGPESLPWQSIDLAFVPELNRWNGLDRIQLRIRDLRPSQPAECP